MSELTAEHRFAELIRIVAKLRDPNGGCPWDLEQTHASLKPYIVEEAYEMVDAIDAGPAKLREELGDVLLQVVLHSQIAKDGGAFDVGDVIAQLSEKLVKRHPHVFGETEVTGTEQVLENWESIKKKDLAKGEGLLDGVPRSMPALLRAHRIGEKVARVGFDWESLEGVSAKVLEELEEFVETISDEKQNAEEQEEELGDLLFTLAQLGRKLGFRSEEALSRANDKFTRRFHRMEELAKKGLKDLPSEDLASLWQRVKSEEKNA